MHSPCVLSLIPSRPPASPDGIDGVNHEGGIRVITGGSDELLRGYRLVTTTTSTTAASSSSSSSSTSSSSVDQQHRVFLGNIDNYTT